MTVRRNRTAAWIAWISLCMVAVALLCPRKVLEASAFTVPFTSSRGSTVVGVKSRNAVFLSSRRVIRRIARVPLRVPKELYGASDGDSPAWGPMKQKIAEPARRQQEKAKEKAKEAAATDAGTLSLNIYGGHIQLQFRGCREK
jgi:hypothetical protein